MSFPGSERNVREGESGKEDVMFMTAIIQLVKDNFYNHARVIQQMRRMTNIYWRIEMKVTI